jgi:hypothetical protein
MFEYSTTIIAKNYITTEVSANNTEYATQLLRSLICQLLL